MPKSTDEFITIKSACELLGVSPNTLRSWGATGKITEYRHPVNNYRLFREDDVKNLVEKLQNPLPHPSSKRKAR